jgi:hypothetical protein
VTTGLVLQVMLGVVDMVCTAGLAVAPGAPPPTVALVVGSAHLPGEQLGGMSCMWVQSPSLRGGSFRANNRP